MKLTILGTSGAYPEKNRSCSGYFVEMDGQNIVLDLGSGTLSNLQNHVNVADLDAIFFSHMHPDHFIDIYCLRYMLEYGIKIGRPLPLWGVGDYMETIISLQPDSGDAFQKIFEFNVSEKEFSVGSLKVETIFTKHPIPTNAIKISGEKAVFVYTGDAGYTEKLAKFASGADILLSECTYDISGPLTELHMRSDEVGNLANETGVKTVVLSHFWPEVDRNKAKSEVGELFSGAVIVADENKTISL